MARGRLRFIGLGAVLLFLNLGAWLWLRSELLAAELEEVRVVAALPEGKADGTAELAFLFDRALVDPAELGSPLADPPFVLDPPLPGTWRWTEPDRLTLDLDAPLPGGRRWIASPREDFAQRLGKRLAGKRSHGFETSGLALRGFELDRVVGKHAEVAVVFDQAVDPRDLAEHVVVAGRGRDPRGSGTELPFEALGESPGTRQVLRVEVGEHRNLTLGIDGELRGVDAELGLGEDVERHLGLPSRLTLLRARGRRTQWTHRPGDVPRSSASLVFSEGLDPNQELSTIEVRPPVDDLSVRVRGHELCLEGAFDVDEVYVASVPPSLLARNGSTLGHSADLGFRVAPPSPRVDFESSRGQLSPEGHLELGLRVGGVEGVELSAWRLHASNLVPHLRGDSVRATSRRLGSKDYALNLEERELRDLTVDLEALLAGSTPGGAASDGPRGLFHLEARGTDNPWVRDRAVVSIADLALVAKREARGWFVWVVSLAGGEPQGDVRVAARSYNDQLLAEAKTDAEGRAFLHLPGGDREAGGSSPDGEAFVILAERGDELAWVQAGRQGWFGFEQAGIGRRAPGPLDAMLFTDRGILRPGETGQVAGLVRRADGSLPAEEALTLVVRDPSGREHGRHPLGLGQMAEGFVHHPFTTRIDDVTGTYVLELVEGEDTVLATKRLSVETFVPARTEMRASLDGSHVLGSAPFRIAVEATSLLGGPAAGLDIRAHGELRPTAFASEAFPAFRFTNPTQLGVRHLPGVEGRLDEGGQGRLELPTELDGVPGLYRGQVVVTVIEPNGRSLSRGLAASVDTAEAHWGLCTSDPQASSRTHGDLRVSVGEEFDVHWIRRDPEDLPSPPGVPARIRLLEVRGEWIPKDSSNGHGYVFEERVTEVSRLEVESFLPGKEYGRARLRCPGFGRYRIELQDPSGPRTTTLEVIAGDSTGGRPRTASPDRIAIDGVTASEDPGPRVRARLHPPFAGTLLVSLETDRVLATQVRSVEGGAVEVAFDLPVAPRGGAYLTAHLVRGTVADAFGDRARTGTMFEDSPKDPSGPRRARGQAKVEFDIEGRDLDLEWTHAEQVLPGDPASISIRRRTLHGDGAGPGHVMLWAVDRGIHLRTGYRTPDPLAHFHGSRRASIECFDIYGDLIAELERPLGLDRIGGDEASMGLRRGTATLRHRRSAVRFLGLAPFDSQGVAEFEFQWPHFQGELELSAVAARGDRYGSATSRVLVRAPLGVQAGWPRTLSMGDRASVPVRVSNRGEEACTVGFQLEFDRPEGTQAGSLAIDGSGARLHVAAGQTVDHVLEVEASSLGTVLPRLSLVCEGASIRSGVDFGECTVRRAATLRSERRLHRLAPLESMEVVLPSTVEVEGSTTLVRAGASPTVELRPALSMLLEYPHGCVEQTASRILPLIHVPGVVAAEGEFSKGSQRLHDLVQSGLARFATMQTSGGGLAYWPGGSTSSPWGSALAAETCLAASRRGYSVDVGFQGRLLDYLEGLLATSKLAEDAAATRARICRVLAGFGRPMRGWTSRLSEEAETLAPAARAHLAMAWFEMGEVERARELLSASWTGVRIPRQLGAAPTGPDLERAILLGALLDVDPEHPGIPGLVRELEDARVDGSWGTTQATSACLVALARYQERQPATSNLEGRWTDARGVVSEFGVEGLEFRTSPTKASVGTIENLGPGDLYLEVEHLGLAAEPPPSTEDRGLRLRRRWLDLEGEPARLEDLAVGDLLRVELSLSAPGLAPGTRIPHVAITDAIPSGFEVENPRLETSARSFDPGAPAEARTEFLDDRVLHFTDAVSEERVVEYLLRATTAGSFAVPAAEASCMDAPDLASIDPGLGGPLDPSRRIEVKP